LVDDDLTEAAAARDRRDRGRRDDEDRRDPDAGDHERQAERELDLEQDLPLAEPHAASRLDDVGIDAVDREVRVREDGRHGENDERCGVVPEPDAEDRQPERDQHDARQRAAETRDADREEEAAVPMSEPEAERQREQQGDPERGERELEVLAGLLEQKGRVVVDEAERIDERVWRESVGDRHARLHGVAARWPSTRRPSAASASATASPPAARISVLKRFWSSAMKMGSPRPLGITNAATVATEIVDTVAMRSPARIAGRASGSSTRRNVCALVMPIPRAASSTSAGTPRRPSTMLRQRTSSVYETSAISPVVTVRPVSG